MNENLRSILIGTSPLASSSRACSLSVNADTTRIQVRSTDSKPAGEPVFGRHLTAMHSLHRGVCNALQSATSSAAWTTPLVKRVLCHLQSPLDFHLGIVCHRNPTELQASVFRNLVLHHCDGCKRCRSPSVSGRSWRIFPRSLDISASRTYWDLSWSQLLEVHSMTRVAYEAIQVEESGKKVP